jgi:DnaJ-class molecular chaperone
MEKIMGDKEKCSTCSGGGDMPCPGCYGKGKVSESDATKSGEKRGWEPCAKCGGKGIITCPRCHGSGES